MPLVQSPAAARVAAGLPGHAYDVPLGDLSQARLHLDALSRPNTLTEIRCKSDHGMRQEFFLDTREAAARAVQLGPQTDVYVGVLPRRLRRGGREALEDGGRVLWAECDTEKALCNALDHHHPPPLIIRSSPGKAHVYWFLNKALPLDLVERGNRRLAWAFGADPASCDAARILRVAGTRNHKRDGDPPRVSITHIDAVPAIAPAALVADLPDPAPKHIPARPARPRLGPDPDRDALAAIPARIYVPLLCGRDVVRGMVSCPFHGGGEERTPSMHVGGPNDTLYHCFGSCSEGGDIFRFAARVWGLDEKRDFPTIKDRLKAAMR